MVSAEGKPKMSLRGEIRGRAFWGIALAAGLFGGCVTNPAAPPSAGGNAGQADGGTGGTTGDVGPGSGGSNDSRDAGVGGTTGTGGGGTAGSGAVDGGGTDGSGPDGGTCGGLGQACCANSCNSGLTCLNGVACSCAKTLFGQYLLRADGALLYETAPPSTVQTAVLAADTARPLAGVTAAMDGVTHGCALQGTTSTVWCWRTAANGNAFGQLGNGATDTASEPLFRATEVLVSGNTPLTGVVAISDGIANFYGLNTCAVTTGGKLYCWGDLTWLVNGGTTELNSPYAIPITTDGVTPLTGVIQVGLTGPFLFAGGGTYACAVVRGASSTDVWCWGVNYEGFLGTGDTANRPFPTKILGVSNASKVLPFGAYGSTCALDGTNVRCWGSNNAGQIGNGAATDSPVLVPTLVTLMGGGSALGNIVDIRVGDSDAICALASDHTVKCWGSGFQPYPTNYGVTNVVAVGSVDGSVVRVLTGDGVYHIGDSTRAPSCGLLP